MAKKCNIGYKCSQTCISKSYICDSELGVVIGEGLNNVVKSILEKDLPLNIPDREFYNSLNSSYKQLQKDMFENLSKHGLVIWSAELSRKFEIESKTDFSEEKEVKRILSNFEKLREMVKNPPSTLEISGKEIPAPINLVPKINRSQIGWYDPMTKASFNHGYPATKKGQDGGASSFSMYIDGQHRRALEFYGNLKLEGKSWPNIKSVSPSESEIDLELKKYEGRELYTLGGNIRDNTSNKLRRELEVWYGYGAEKVEELRLKDKASLTKGERKIINDYKGPDLVIAIERRKTKEREIIKAYLESDKRSPFTGDKIDDLKERGITFDHLIPISDFYKKYGVSVKNGKNLIQEEVGRVVSSSDRSDNIQIVEGGLNGRKGKKSNEEFLNDLRTLDADFEKSLSERNYEENYPQYPLFNEEVTKRVFKVEVTSSNYSRITEHWDDYRVEKIKEVAHTTKYIPALKTTITPISKPKKVEEGGVTNLLLPLPSEPKEETLKEKMIRQQKERANKTPLLPSEPKEETLREKMIRQQKEKENNTTKSKGELLKEKMIKQIEERKRKQNILDQIEEYENRKNSKLSTPDGRKLLDQKINKLKDLLTKL